MLVFLHVFSRKIEGMVSKKKKKEEDANLEFKYRQLCTTNKNSFHVVFLPACLNYRAT